MKWRLAAVCAVVCLASLASASEVRVTGEVGVSICTLSEGYVDSLGAPHTGVAVDINLSDGLWLETGAAWARRGGRSASLNRELMLDYIEIPAIVKFSSGPGRAYSSAGLKLGINTRVQMKDLTADTITDLSTDTVEPINLALTVGIGGAFSIGSRSALAIGLEYSQGLTKVMDGSDAVSRAFTVIKIGLTF